MTISNYMPLKVVSIDNSSSINLTSATSLGFTGVWEDVKDYTSITVFIDGTSSGVVEGDLEVQFSQDGINIHKTISFTNSDVTDVLPRSIGVMSKYFRVMYTSVSDLLTFNLQVMFHLENIINNVTLDQILQGTEDVQLVRNATNFDLDVARKHIIGQDSSFFFGFNDSVTSTWQDIHPFTGDINWLTVGGKVELISSDAADNGTTPGLGVQSVKIYGLSLTGVAQDEVILTNGISAVESVNSYIRINKMSSETCGTYGGSNQGDITCRVTGAGSTLSVMTGQEGLVDVDVVYGAGESGNGYFSVPLGKVMYITRIEVMPDVSVNKIVDIVLYKRENILDITTPFSPRRELWSERSATKAIEKVFKSHVKIKSLTDLFFRAKSSGTSPIQVSLDFYLVDEDLDGY